MNDEEPSSGLPATSSTRRRSVAAQTEAALVVVLPLEQPAGIRVDARSHEDELRLRCWLRKSSALRALPAVVTCVLDELDEQDRRRAA
jgi:hypothetical protein